MAQIILCIYILSVCMYSTSSALPFLETPIENDRNKSKDNANTDFVVNLNQEALKAQENEKQKDEIPVINVNLKTASQTNAGKPDVKTISSTANSVKTANITSSKIFTENVDIKSSTNTDTEVESGAVMRGIYVFVAIALLFIMYIGFKTYRRRNKKNVLIKKYGVRTRRSDVEMEPLPLEEDEDDETVFDLGNLNNR